MPESALTKLKKTDYLLFLDTSDTHNTATWTPGWKRATRSTMFSLNPNPQVNTLNYIGFETPISEVDSYQPELPQDIALYEGDPVFDYVRGKFHELPTGDDAKIPVLLCFGGTDKKAWQVEEATIQLGELNSVDGKQAYTLKLGGNITKGTYTVTAGAPTFTAAT